VPSASFPGKDEDLKALHELQDQRKQAAEIVQRWFRYRARRGIGIFYLIVALAPVLGDIAGTLTRTTFVGIAVGTVMVFLAWIFGRAAGAQSFDRMNLTLRLLKESSNQTGQTLVDALKFMVLLWPWFAYAAAALRGLPIYEFVISLIWLAQNILYRFVVPHRRRNLIVEMRWEDWLVTLSVPVIALAVALGGLQLFPPVSLSDFLLITPFLLVAGLASLYEAPKELVPDLDQ
jgi:hypothetical protein